MHSASLETMTSSGGQTPLSISNETSSANPSDSELQPTSNSQTENDNMEYQLALEVLDTDSQDENYEPEGN